MLSKSWPLRDIRPIERQVRDRRFEVPVGQCNGITSTAGGTIIRRSVRSAEELEGARTPPYGDVRVGDVRLLSDSLSAVYVLAVISQTSPFGTSLLTARATVRKTLTIDHEG